MEFTNEELRLLGAGMTAAGLIGNGEQPRHQLLELLVVNREAMHALTKKIVDAIE